MPLYFSRLLGGKYFGYIAIISWVFYMAGLCVFSAALIFYGCWGLCFGGFYGNTFLFFSGAYVCRSILFLGSCGIFGGCAMHGWDTGLVAGEGWLVVGQYLATVVFGFAVFFSFSFFIYFYIT